LRAPWKPAPPADSQAITLPVGSVRETIVLLKDVLMWACPIGMFFLGLRRPRARLGAGGTASYRAFFLPATCIRFGPLRVRALVLVFCPRTGRPRRWRNPR